jgi:hypothetical protein
MGHDVRSAVSVYLPALVGIKSDGFDNVLFAQRPYGIQIFRPAVDLYRYRLRFLEEFLYLGNLADLQFPSVFSCDLDVRKPPIWFN